MKFDKVKIRAVIGLVLMITAILGMYWWENTGRAEVMFTEVLVVKKDMNVGDIIRLENMKKIKILPFNKLENPLKEKDIQSFKNKKIKQFIPKGSQVTKEMLADEDEIKKENPSIFKIPVECIESYSSSLRKGDKIKILTADETKELGEFKVAHIKDEEECEITNLEGLIEDNVFKRDNNSSVIKFIEIVATLEEYKKIESEIVSEEKQLLVLQKGEF